MSLYVQIIQMVVKCVQKTFVSKEVLEILSIVLKGLRVDSFKATFIGLAVLS